MKKIITGFLIVLTGVFTFATMNLNLFAKEDLIDLYPNESIDHLKGQYGNSGWVLDFGGYRYHTTIHRARRVSTFDEANKEAKTVFKAADMPEIRGVSANAMGGFIHNDLDRKITLETADRTDLTNGSVNRMWATFDGEGRLTTFEDHISLYYITEVDGTEYYRLSTPAEIKEFEDAEEGEKPSNILHARIRAVLDADNEKYKVEPLGYLKWTNANLVIADPKQEIEASGKASVIYPEDRNPNHVVLEKGGIALHFGTWDRGKPLFNQLIAALPGLLASQTERAKLSYLNPAPYFANLVTKDVNPNEDGVNFVYKINDEPKIDKLIEGVEARHVNKEQSIFVEETFSKVDYSVVLRDEAGLELERIEVKYNAETKKYTPAAESFTKLDTKVFGNRYLVTFETTQPKLEGIEDSYVTGPTTVVNGIIDVGVLPIHFTGVKDIFINEGLSLEKGLLNGIKAFKDSTKDSDDISNSLKYTLRDENGTDHFNIFNVKAGTYQVEVTASYIYGEPEAGQSLTIKSGNLEHTFEPSNINPIASIGVGGATNLRRGVLITKEEIFNKQIDNLKNDIGGNNGLAYGQGFVMFDASNKIVAYYAYEAKKAMGLDGKVYDIVGEATAAGRNTFLNKLKWNADHKFIAFTTRNMGEKDPHDLAKMLYNMDDKTEFKGIPLYYLVDAKTTYTISVADITNPTITALQENFTIYTDNTFGSVAEALYSNVNAYDEHGYTLSIPTAAGRIDLTTPGEHDVSVIATDKSGNSATVTFKLIIKEARASEEDLDNKVGDLEDIIKDLEDKLTGSEAELQKAIDGKTTLVMVIVFSVISMVVSIGASVAVIFLKKN